MNEELMKRMSRLSEEELLLLGGQPLQQSTYTEGRLFEVSSEKLLSPKQMIAVRPHTRFTPFPHAQP